MINKISTSVPIWTKGRAATWVRCFVVWNKAG
jgi:hypothetical protein